MPPIGPEAPHPIPAGMKVNKKNKYDEDVIDNNEEKVIRGKAKDITQKRLYLETMERVLPGIEKVIVPDEDSGNMLNLLNLTTSKGGEK